MNCILEILVGLPASGKSTYTEKQRKIYGDSLLVVSSDAIRKELFGSEEDQEHNSEVFNEVFKRVKNGILNYERVILDATNLNRKRRINFLKQLPECIKIATVFAIPFEICCERNKNRNRTVPQNVMERMYKNFQPPHYDEGFFKINFIKEKNLNTTLEEIFLENRRCPHDNPHHKLSCGDHCIYAADWVQSSKEIERFSVLDQYLIRNATRYHDLSKYKCKVFNDIKGKPTNIAHYYNHENVSAYDYMCYNYEIDDYKIVIITNLISNHMIFYSGDEGIKTRKKIYNKHFWEMLELVHKADVVSH